MGLKLRDDVFKPVQKVSTDIVLPNSLVTLRDVNKFPGQQFETGTLSVAIPALSANTLYFVYLVAPAGVPQLVIDTNIPSVGPTGGYTSWQLVGAFYSNSSSNFGALTSILGRPISDTVSEPTVWGGVGGDPTKGGNIALDYIDVIREGKWMFAEWSYKHQTAGVGGSGNLQMVIPLGVNHAIDVGAGFSAFPRPGSFSYNNAGSNVDPDFDGNVVADHNTTRRLRFYQTDSDGIPSASVFGSIFVVHSGYFRIPIQEWSETPLIDL